VSTLRVLVITPDFPPAPGGIQLLISRLIQHAEDWRPLVVAVDHPDGDRHDRAVELPVRRAGSGLPHRAAVAALNAQALATGLRERPDLVLSAHLVTAPSAAALERLRGVPWLQYAYGMEIDTRARLARWALPRATAVVAISRYTAGKARGLGAPAERVHVVPPAADRPLRPLPSAKFDRPTIVTVARLEDRYKGFDVMLRALPLVRAQVPGTQWLVVGEGSLRPELEATARAWGISDAVHFLGRVDDAERDELLARSHVFAMPSRAGPGGGEGFGIVFLEAALHGLPCVAGRAGGALDAVADGESGLLVDPSDHLAVADALVELLRDPARAAAMGEAALQRAQTFTWQAMAARIDAIARAAVARAR